MVAFLKKYRVVIFALLAILIILFVGIIFLARWAVNDLFESDKVTPTASQYSEWVGIWLPADVQKFQSYGEGWQDWLVEARFELTTSQFTAFLERNNLVRSESQSVVESNYTLEWFSSAGALEQYEIKPLPESAASTLMGFYPTIWIDHSNSDKVIIYIKAFDT